MNAYNQNNYPQWYYPYGYQNPQLNGNRINGMPSNTQQMQNELVTVLVKDDAAVQNYPVANGNSVLLMNYDSGKFWIKSMYNGVSPTIVEHTFMAVDTNKNANENVISRDEFDELSKTVSKLQSVIDDLNS